MSTGVLLKLLSTAAFGALDLWIGFLAGLAAGLSSVASGVAAVAGALAGVAAVFFIGERLQRRIYAHAWLAKRRARIERVWNRYGVVGVALQAPMVTGAPLGTVLALALGAPLRPLLRWMILSVLLWGAVLTGAATFGFSVFDVRSGA